MSSSVMHIERDLKLSVPPRFRMPNLAEYGAIQTGPPRQSTTIFYDTADLALAGWGCLLRHRTREGWTVKLPDLGTGDGLERPEIAFDGPPGDPPAAALELLIAFLRGRSVAPVARMKMLRKRIVIPEGRGGATLLEVVDDRVTADGGARRTMRQLEIELRDASAGELRDRVVGALTNAGAEAGDRRTKYAWVLGDRVPAPEVSAPSITPRSTAADVARYGLATSVIALIHRDADVRGASDPEAVHQARVVVRRLRSDLRTFKGVLHVEWTRALRMELDWLGEILGRVRDRQVLAARLREGRDADDGDIGPVIGILEDEVARARVDLADAMGSERYRRLLDDLIDAARNPRVYPAEGTAAAVLRPAVDRSWKRLRKAVRAVRADPAGHELHPVRIEAKRLRYTCEMLGPVFGKRARRLASAAKELQDVLGQYQDAVVARDWLRDHSAADGASTAFALGELAALEVVARDRAEAEWPAVWKALRRRRPTKWR